jgi:hypothetical protein
VLLQKAMEIVVMGEVREGSHETEQVSLLVDCKNMSRKKYLEKMHAQWYFKNND